MNTLQAGSVAKIKKPFTKEAQLENINAFLTAVKAYGVPEDKLFAPEELNQATNIPKVINCLLALGRQVSFHSHLLPTAPLFLILQKARSHFSPSLFPDDNWCNVLISCSVTLTIGRVHHWGPSLRDKRRTGRKMCWGHQKLLSHHSMDQINLHHKKEFDLVPRGISLQSSNYLNQNQNRRKKLQLKIPLPKHQENIWNNTIDM